MGLYLETSVLLIALADITSSRVFDSLSGGRDPGPSRQIASPAMVDELASVGVDVHVNGTGFLYPHGQTIGDSIIPQGISLAEASHCLSRG